MDEDSDTRLLVLHGVRLKGMAEAGDIAALVGRTADEVTVALEQLRADGLVGRRDGPRLSGWVLTDRGRAEQGRLLAQQLDASGRRDAVHDAYRSFLSMNRLMLEICTAWQMKDETSLNDHSDSAYDAEVIERLLGHDRAVQPILDELEQRLDRYAIYRSRFATALELLRSGDHDWLASPAMDSYHTVWFQLHEDLLNTLGIDRASEARG